jgi:hypothetical protein
MADMIRMRIEQHLVVGFDHELTNLKKNMGLLGSKGMERCDDFTRYQTDHQSKRKALENRKSVLNKAKEIVVETLAELQLPLGRTSIGCHYSR